MNLYKIENNFITSENTTSAIAHLKAKKKIKFAKEAELICECHFIIPTIETGKEMNLYLVTGDDKIKDYIMAPSILDSFKKFDDLNPELMRVNSKFICKRKDIISTIKIK